VPAPAAADDDEDDDADSVRGQPAAPSLGFPTRSRSFPYVCNCRTRPSSAPCPASLLSSADADGEALGFFVGFFVGFFDGAAPSDAPSLLLLAADAPLTGAAVGLPPCDAHKITLGHWLTPLIRWNYLCDHVIQGHVRTCDEDEEGFTRPASKSSNIALASDTHGTDFSTFSNACSRPSQMRVRAAIVKNTGWVERTDGR